MTNKQRKDIALEWGAEQESSKPLDTNTHPWKFKRDELETLFLGSKPASKVFNDIRRESKGLGFRQGQCNHEKTNAASPDAKIEENIYNAISKQKMSKNRLIAVLRSACEIEDSLQPLKTETARIGEMALSHYADRALVQTEPTAQGLEDIWKGIDADNTRAVAHSAWLNILAILWLRCLKEMVSKKQVIDFLWRALFVETRIKPKHILEELNYGSILTVDEDILVDLVEQMTNSAAYTEKRLAEILQMCDESKTIVQEQILKVAEKFLQRKGMPLTPVSRGKDNFFYRVEEWLCGRRKRSLQQKERDIFFAALHVGLMKDELSGEATINLLERFLSASVKQKYNTPPQDRNLHIANALLSAPLGKTSDAAFNIFTTMQKKQNKTDERLESLQHQLYGEHKQSERLQSVVAEKSAKINDLEGELAALESKNTNLQAKVAELDKDLLRFQDGLTHRVDQLRSKVQSVLEGRAMRHLQNALEAINAEPPWVEAAEERIEDAMKVLKKEAECLRHSQ